MHKGRRLLRFFGLACVLLALGGLIYPLVASSWSSARWDPRHETYVDPFRRVDTVLSEQDFEGLVRYFLAGFITYARPELSRARYPGAPSNNGRRVDEMEGFTRFLPLAAAWLASGRSQGVTLGDQTRIDLLALVKTGLTNGVNPASPGYWGNIRDRDNRIAEAADISLALWLLRERLWPDLSAQERARVVSWLRQVGGKRMPDNNWHLFPVLTSAVLKALGESYDAERYRSHYARLKSFYRGGGWFSDGPRARFDFYNAWEIHYHLLWLDQIDPSLDRNFIREVHRVFAKSWVHFFSPTGFPILGRSICYRVATPAPLVLGDALGLSPLPAGQARRALEVTWRYYGARGGIRDGRVTQGYCGDDLRFLDRYSGPASCLWSLRSLIAAMVNPPGSGFWSASPSPLPVEQGNFVLYIPEVGWRVAGVRQGHVVTISQARGTLSRAVPPRDHPLYARWFDTITGFYGLTRLVGGPYRPDNRHLAYSLQTYSSDAPFCGCAGVDR